MGETRTAGRRDLGFARLDEVMPDVDRLLAGHETAGRWTLGQICNHLMRVVVYSAEGGTLPGAAPWPIRATIGPIIKRRVFARGGFPEGIRIPSAPIPLDDLDDRAEAEALRAALRLFAGCPAEGPAPMHPFFGAMSHGDWDRLHRIHCAHHLSFARPR